MTEIGPLPKDWEVGEFSKDLEIRGRIGWKGYQKTDLRDYGPWVLGGSNIKSKFYIDFSDEKHLELEKFKESPEIILEKGDVIVVTRGNLGDIGYFDGSLGDATINPSLIILRDFKGFPPFLFYYLVSKDGQENLLSLRSGSSVPAIYQADVRKLKYPKPPIETQRRIASILTALDEKIELNRRMNETLEGIARAVCVAWFEEMGATDLIELGELIEFNPRVSIEQKEEVAYVEMKDVPENGMCVSGFVQKPFSGGSKFQVEDTLFARITPCLENGKTAFVNFLGKNEKGFGSTEFIVMRARKGVSPFYVYFMARDEKFRQFAIGSMVGSSGRQRVQTEMLPSFEVFKPGSQQMVKFDEFAKPIFREIYLNFHQSRTLSALRDALLPRLMRGDFA